MNKEYLIRLIKEIQGIIEEDKAIQMLEYHNKNHLAGDNKSRSECRMERLDLVMHRLNEVIEKIK